MSKPVPAPALWQEAILRHRVRDNRVFTPVVLAVAFALHQHMDLTTGQCYPSQKRLAGMAGTTRESTNRAIAVLRKSGWLSVSRPSAGRLIYQAEIPAHAMDALVRDGRNLDRWNRDHGSHGRGEESQGRARRPGRTVTSHHTNHPTNLSKIDIQKGFGLGVEGPEAVGSDSSADGEETALHELARRLTKEDAELIGVRLPTTPGLLRTLLPENLDYMLEKYGLTY